MKFRNLGLLLNISLFGLSACGANDRIHSGGKAVNSTAQEENSGDQTGDQTVDQNIDQEEVLRDEIVTPPKEYYDQLLADRILDLDAPQGLSLAGTLADQVIWVNFDGATLQKGYSRGQSFILCKSSANIPAASLSPAQKDQILLLVQEHYNKAGAKLIVTPNKPALGDFTTMHVGGAYGDLGCRGRGVLGVAPFDVGNSNRNDIGFAFTSGVSDITIIAETISHEAGHSFGLDHVQNSKDLMYASSAPNIEGFLVSRVQGSTRIQDEPAILKQVLGALSPGETQAPETPSTPTLPTSPSTPSTPTLPTLPNLPTSQTTPTLPIPGMANLPDICSGLPGLAQLGNLGSLLPALGGSGAGSILDITQLMPQLGTLLPGGLGAGAGLPGFDKIFTLVGLASTAGGIQNGAAPAVPGITGLAGIVDPNLASSILGNTGGLDLSTLTSLAGVGSVGAGVGGLQDLINSLGLQAPVGGTTNVPTLPGTTGTPNLGTLPDMSQLLGLLNSTGGVAGGVGGIADISTLLNGLSASGRVVSSNYQGEDRDALMSLLKVAYTQAYEQQFH
jgi:hypothetical protein